MNGLLIDCFAGGGGASKGIELALNRPIDIAINHDPEAIRIHRVNHPYTLHLTEDIFTVDLPKYVAGRPVDLMWASPDCTSHSKAKGGQPRHQGLRILPWAVYKHAKAILPEVIIMENVEEIQQWGPLDATGRPIKERAGEDYIKFISSMCSLGYAFDSRELVAADYGAPTTRKRWYAIFRRDKRPIIWPAPTHSKEGRPGTEKWVPCGDFIDWSDLGRSIFDRPKPLADATLRRIANGYRKYVVENPTPYIVNNREAVSFLIQYHGETKAGDARGQLLTEPIKPILKYLKMPCTVWCPFDTAESNFVKMLKRYAVCGVSVVHTHIATGDDFFSITPPQCDYIISNPPYSVKGPVLKRLFQIGKPFAMLVGVVGLFESQERFEMFRDNPFEIMYLNRRVAYFKDYTEQKPSLNPPFSSVYVCHNMLPERIVFEEIEKR